MGLFSRFFGGSGGGNEREASGPRETAAVLHGFAKSERDNIDDDELADLRKLGAAALNNDEAAIDAAIAASKLWEIDYVDED